MFSPKIGASYNFWNFWECSQVFLKDNSRNSFVLESRRIIKYVWCCREREPRLLWGRGGLRRVGGGRDWGGRRGVFPVAPAQDSPDCHVQKGVLVSSGHLARLWARQSLNKFVFPEPCRGSAATSRQSSGSFLSREASITVKFYLSHWDPGKDTAPTRPSLTFTLFCSILETFQFREISPKGKPKPGTFQNSGLCSIESCVETN